MGSGSSIPVKSDYPAPISFHSQGPTEYIGGVPGYTVLDNVWYNDKKFYLIGDDHGQIPNNERLFTASTGWGDGTKDIVTFESKAEGPEVEDGITEINGTTIFLNDGWPGSWSGYFMYYHFASEIILGSYSVLSSIQKPLPSDLKKPWNIYKGLGRRLSLQESKQLPLTSSADKVDINLANRILFAWELNWDGKDGLSRAVSEGLVGKDGIIDPAGWRDMTNDNKWIYFERLLLTDRETAHRNNPLSQVWYKMALDAYKLTPSSKSLSPMREKFLNHYNIPIQNRHKSGKAINNQKVKVVYADRQGSDRKFPDNIHKDLLKQLERIEEQGKAIIIDAKLENIDLKGQFELFSDADIIFGVHGNGLTHEMWMPTGGIVIECFPKTTFAYDYAPISEVLGHKHIIWREDQEFPPDQWKPQNGGNGNALHDGTRFPLNVKVFSEWLESKIDEML
ncbi:uncharacterized protein I206_102531 [Kwoniella pini CBS 10737]|uniref:Glycosyltransferase 61 catalytic domain-containing protein n=1 Tax=Kwoniella pini CBS 10737 TaxID=1296096 RepID=A0A1B9I5M0_9TREE|nr:uncharacterized protein I206_02882 [Kwoniella pini CBS 10737]OCF50825.1 hypothetical protein I206_02882 [Kwoniella pini CBS 10737]